MIKIFTPFCHAKNIFDIDVEFFSKLKIKYILCDIDNTLDSYKTTFPSENVFNLKESLLKKNISLILVSNNTGKRVKLYADKLGVDYFNSLRKPFPFKLNKIIKQKSLNKNELILIGDQTVTDIACSNACHVKGILVDKLVPEDQPTTRFNRLFDRPIRKILLKKHLLKDWREYYGN